MTLNYFNSATVASKAPTQKDSNTIRLYCDEHVFNDNDLVRISGEDENGYFNQVVRIDYLYENSHYFAKIVGSSSWSEISRARKGTTYVKVDGKSIVVDARDSNSDTPFIEGYDTGTGNWAGNDPEWRISN